MTRTINWQTDLDQFIPNNPYNLVPRTYNDVWNNVQDHASNFWETSNIVAEASGRGSSQYHSWDSYICLHAAISSPARSGIENSDYPLTGQLFIDFLDSFVVSGEDVFFMQRIIYSNPDSGEDYSFSWYDTGATITAVTYGGSQPVPEPATMLLMGTGLVGFVGWKRRQAKK